MRRKKFNPNAEFKIGFVMMSALIVAELLVTIDDKMMWFIWWGLGAYFMFNQFLPHRKNRNHYKRHHKPA